jgi:hypothetical protein
VSGAPAKPARLFTADDLAFAVLRALAYVERGD